MKLDRKEAERAPSKKKGTKERAYSEDDMRALLKLCLTDQISLQAACVQQRMPTVRQSGRRWAATSRPSKLQCRFAAASSQAEANSVHRRSNAIRQWAD